ncbi:MAG: GNAT family N-acetyltransferase [Bacteroidetes bacterium]|nr:GNAT family N-acetyltransferase [Bacteroidota bacterium]
MATWIYKKFEDLTVLELYACLQLRNEVFVVEQHCVFQDADNKDQFCFHLMGWEQKKLIAYTRIVPPGICYEEISIGRVVTSPSARGRGLGRALMQNSISIAYSLFSSASSIKIGAQLYLKNFYKSLGFVQCSDIYLEDGIEHIRMILQKK